MVMGIKGRPSFGQATITVKDYSGECVSELLDECRYLFKDRLNTICDEKMHEEIFDQARLVLARVDKLKYLLTLR